MTKFKQIICLPKLTQLVTKMTSFFGCLGWCVSVTRDARETTHSSATRSASSCDNNACQLPTATVRNCHKLSGLKEHRLTVFQFWGSEVRNESYKAGVKVHPSGSPRGEPTSLPPPGSKTSCVPWLGAPSSVFRGSHSSLPLHGHASLPASGPPASYTGPARVTQRRLPSSGSLTSLSLQAPSALAGPRIQGCWRVDTAIPEDPSSSTTRGSHQGHGTLLRAVLAAPLATQLSSLKLQLVKLLVEKGSADSGHSCPCMGGDGSAPSKTCRL